MVATGCEEQEVDFSNKESGDPQFSYSSRLITGSAETRRDRDVAADRQKEGVTLKQISQRDTAGSGGGVRRSVREIGEGWRSWKSKVHSDF